jgi:hypothetical protein
MRYIYIYIYISLHTPINPPCIHTELYDRPRACGMACAISGSLRQSESDLALNLTSTTISTHWIQSQHQCIHCFEVLTIETGMHYNRTSQWYCRNCATMLVGCSDLALSPVPREVAIAILNSIDSFSWKCVHCLTYESVTKQMMAFHYNQCNSKSQILLGGAFVDSGFGSLRPRINQNSCPKIGTNCRFCGVQLVSLEDWPVHIMTECTRVPCAFSRAHVYEGILDFADRIFLDNSAKFVNVSSIIDDHCNDHFCTWGTCDTTTQTWKQMLQHLQKHIHDVQHEQVKIVLSLLREKIKGANGTALKRKECDSPHTSGKSPRYAANTPRVITCCKKVPTDVVPK